MRIIRELISMSSATYVDRAAGWSRLLEESEARRSGQPIRSARERVARRLGLSSGTLENLRNGRLKAIAVHVYERLHAGVDAELAQEMRRLEHARALVTQQGLGPHSDEAQEVDADLAIVRRLLRLDGGAA